MLVLSRKAGETIVINGSIRVKIVRMEGDVVKVGIEAPGEVPVHREEVYNEIQRNNQEAVKGTGGAVPRLSVNRTINQTSEAATAS